MKRLAKDVDDFNASNRLPSRRRGPRTSRGHFMWPAVTVAGLAACLSGDDGTSRMGEQSDSAGAVGAPGAGTAAIQLTPGGIVDTQPNSGWTEGSF
jgi:hypothetical protein